MKGRVENRSLAVRFWRLTGLNILSNITVPLVGLVDTAMLGHLQHIRFLAGVALASVIFEYVYWSFGFLRMSTTGTTAQAVGRGDRREVFLTLYRSLALAAGIGAAILLLRAPIREAGFALLSGAPEVEAAGRDYFRARIWGAPGALAGFALLGWFLGREEAGKTLFMNAAANLANVALNYLFIIRWGWAAFGAGLATMASSWIMAGAGVALLLRSDPIRCRLGEVVDWNKTSALLRLNTDILLRTLGLITAFGLFANFSAKLGTNLLAANSILLRFLAFASFAIDGVAFASESLAGIFRGRGDLGSLRRLFRIALAASFSMGVAFALALALGGASLVGLLTSHQNIIALAHQYRWGLFATILLGSLAYAYDGLYLGLTAGRLLRNAMLAATIGGFLPLGLLAVNLETPWLLWAAMAAFMAVRAAILGFAGSSLAARGKSPRGAAASSEEGNRTPIKSR